MTDQYLSELQRRIKEENETVKRKREAWIKKKNAETEAKGRGDFYA
jgi:hypothetical protein